MLNYKFNYIQNAGEKTTIKYVIWEGEFEERTVKDPDTQEDRVITVFRRDTKISNPTESYAGIPSDEYFFKQVQRVMMGNLDTMAKETSKEVIPVQDLKNQLDVLPEITPTKQ